MACLTSGCVWHLPSDDQVSLESHAINLTNHPASDRNPACSPDDGHIAFDSDRDGDRNIYVMTRHGDDVRQLTFHEAADSAPRWSPDGKRLVFQSDREGKPDLYTVELETGEIERLTDMEDGTTEPDWSLDGSRIAFISNHRLYTLDVETRHIAPILLDMPRVHGPAWSGDGKRLAFFARPDGHDDIVVLDLPSGDTRIVTNDPGHQFAPCWYKATGLVYASNTTTSGRAELRFHHLERVDDY